MIVMPAPEPWEKIEEVDKNVLFCYAVKEEVGRAPSRFYNVSTLVTGMGRKNAAEGITRALDAKNYRLVLTCGFAGGLNPELTTGTVVFDEDENADLGEKLVRFGAVPAKFYCAKRVAVTATEKQELWRSTGADVVEMESSVIRAICKERGIPSATVRVVLDTAQEDLPLDFNILMTSRQKINYPKLIWILLSRPHKILPLWKFQRQSMIAAQNLDKVLGNFFQCR